MSDHVHERETRLAETGSTASLGDKQTLGVLLLASSLQLLYMNQRAWHFTRHFYQSAEDPKARGTLPRPLLDAFSEMLADLKRRMTAQECQPFEALRVIPNGRCQFVIRGIGLPDPLGFAHSRMLFILDELSHHAQGVLTEAFARFSLTQREQTVIEHLLKGWTNKEIANAMRITEPTVKEHIRHIMDKTKTTTRTAVLMRLLGQRSVGEAQNGDAGEP